MNYAIEFDGVHWKPGKDFALSDLNLQVPRGSIYGFLGPNGSGKTSSIRLMMGMMRPDRGEIRILGGRVPRELPRVLQRVGYMPERPHVFDQLTVKEVLDFHRSFYPDWDRHWAAELLDRLELPPHRAVKRMSKGQAGKLMMLMALAARPQLLILDEPTDGLDPVVRRDIMTTVLDYVAEAGATVFVSSHLVHELERICDWVGVVDDGRLVAEMPINDFKNRIKRLRFEQAPRITEEEVPFELLQRLPANGVTTFETWTVHGWDPSHRHHLESRGIHLREVIDLDLEEGFVELLRAQRAAREDR